MPSFDSKPFRRATTATSSLGEKVGALYRSKLSKYPFILFGLPFMAMIVAGSFVLTPATAIRYERHDRKVQQLSQEEAISQGLGKEGIKHNPRRRMIGNEKDEYYTLMAKDLDNWEQKRIKRFEGEPDGRL